MGTNLFYPRFSLLISLIYLTTSNVKSFADNTSLFSVTHDVDAFARELNNLEKLSDWSFQLKISFNEISIQPCFSGILLCLRLTLIYTDNISKASSK